MMTRLSMFSLLAVAIAFASGCGGSAPKTVSGKVVLLPNVKFADTDTLSISFAPEKEGTPGYASTEVSVKDGSFSLKLQPGKYKVGFSVTPYPGTPDSERRAEFMTQKFEPFGVTKSSMTYEVTSDASQTITVDLAQGRVAKN